MGAIGDFSHRANLPSASLPGYPVKTARAFAAPSSGATKKCSTCVQEREVRSQFPPAASLQTFGSWRASSGSGPVGARYPLSCVVQRHAGRDGADVVGLFHQCFGIPHAALRGEEFSVVNMNGGADLGQRVEDGMNYVAAE